MSEVAPEGKKRPVWLVVAVIAVVAIVALAVTFGYLLNPSLSPVATIRDSDGDGVTDAEDVFPSDPNEWLDSDNDGVGDNGDAFPLDSSESEDSDSDGIGDNADFWDSGNGGLVIKIERFELIAGICDFFSNCEPSFRLEVDIDGDGVTDISRRADFVDFLDTMALINPVEWAFDIPDNIASVELIIVVMELDVDIDDQIDVHPDSQFIAGWVSVNAPFAYKKFVTQGDQEPSGRLTYSISATGV